MKILVFADSHTDVGTMAAVVAAEKPATVLHLGDHRADALALQGKFPGLSIHIVAGNTDAPAQGEDEQTLCLGDRCFFMTHGHRYDVGGGIQVIGRAGMERKADFVLFGHTHQPYVTYDSGMWFMNPGRIGRISSKIIHASYGVIRLENGGVRCEIAEVPPAP